MSVTWRKVWRDLTLTGKRARTVLAVLSIAVGVFALGVIYGTYDIICSRLEENQRATVPVHMTFWRYPFDFTAAEAVLHEPGIADVETQVDSYILWKLEGDKYWHTANLIARADYEKQRMGLVNLVSGHWPTKRTLVVERQTARYFNIPPAQPSSYNPGCTSRDCRSKALCAPMTALPRRMMAPPLFMPRPRPSPG